MVEPRFTFGQSFSEGLANVDVGTESNRRAGYVNKDGALIIEPKFLSAYRFRNGLAFVETEKTIGYIDKSGEFVWEGRFVEFPRIHPNA